MIGILDDLDNGGAILNYLIDNLDEAERVYALSPAKMAVELTKLSTKIVKEAEEKAAAEKAAKKKEISKVPEPKEPVNGSAKLSEEPKDTDSMDDWVAKRNKQVAERAERKRQGLR